MAHCILIFGGTFDPPHRAHAELPRLVAKQLGCDRIIYVPTSQNPLKDDHPSSAEDRFNMLRLALRECECCEISRIELDHRGPSYTVDTLKRIHEELCQSKDGLSELRLLMGADAALSFPRWKNPEQILELATPVVMLRPPLDRATFERELRGIYPPTVVERWRSWTVDVPMMDVDATALRRKLDRGDDVGDDIDPKVAVYIRQHGLYQV